jgi:ribose-phosphate pyrophosphokinase
MENLKLIVLENAEALGKLVNNHLKLIRNNEEGYIVPIKESRFANGEGKLEICESIREKDVYILADVGNYSITKEYRGMPHILGPDEHFADVKRVIAASSNHALKVSVVMPLLYESRQHKRKGRESLDCAMGLQELESYHIKNFVTFDAHDPSIANAVPRMAFDNFFATSSVLETMYKTESKDDIKKELLVIAPDMGAVERARYYADILSCGVGCFNKRRDYSKLINGKNPIIAHEYLGPDVRSKNIIIVDDMIASGGSVLEVALEAKKRGADKVFISATFALFTEGIEKFDENFKSGIIDRVYSTNLTYVPENIKNREWYVEVDCSKKIAEIINCLNQGSSLEEIHHDGNSTYNKIKKLKK